MQQKLCKTVVLALEARRTKKFSMPASKTKLIALCAVRSNYFAILQNLQKLPLSFTSCAKLQSVVCLCLRRIKQNFMHCVISRS